jgi:hypothetical protein
MALRRKDHLARAKEYIAEGDNYYAKAADEIIAAMDEDADLSWTVVAARVGMSDRWCRRLVTQRRDHLVAGDPAHQFKVDWERGSHATTEEVERGVQKALADPTKAKALAPSIAKAMETPEVAQAVSAQSSREALTNTSIAASTESYMRRRAAETPPPADAASRSLGGIGPAAMSDQIHSMSLEPYITRVSHALASLRTHVGIRGAHLALTDVDEFASLDEEVRKAGEDFAFMLDSIDAAKAAKLANEAEGQKR